MVVGGLWSYQINSSIDSFSRDPVFNRGYGLIVLQLRFCILLYGFLDLGVTVLNIHEKISVLREVLDWIQGNTATCIDTPFFTSDRASNRK